MCAHRIYDLLTILGHPDHLCLDVWGLLDLSWDQALSWLLPAPRAVPARWGFPVASWGNGRALERCQHLGLLPQAQEALLAPPGSSRRAPGQLVAISSTDYLVAMPSGVRAPSPAPRDTLLAGMQGLLG
jgi:hypothetical protein